MVKFFLAILFSSGLLIANESKILDETIQSIVGMQTYNANKALINTAFKYKNIYTNGTYVDLFRVLKTLKEHKIINLSLKGTQAVNLSFKTERSSRIVVKIISDALRDLGYLKYTTKDSSANESQFIWSIEYSTNTIIDPIALQAELSKAGAHIRAIEIQTPTSWSYEIDTKDAHLNVEKLGVGDNINLEQVNGEKWIDVSDISQVDIISDSANSWYPLVSFYDASLNLLKVEKIDKKTSYITLNVPEETMYMKISDLYMATNIKNGLNIEAKESR